ncbi:MAG: ubiquinone/menaquinone biosynthesis methyltransferase [Gemmatimonadaceae bacterium]
MPNGKDDSAGRLRAMDVEQHLADPAIRQRFVTTMFDVVAPRYDHFTRVFSFDMDREWKRELAAAAAALAPHSGAVVLDLACGTGDIAFALAKRLAENGKGSGARILGLDASSRMVDLANARLAKAPCDGLSFRRGDIMAIDRPPASADIVSAGYALRNVPDFRAALHEIARVLRPGGHLLTLDFYRPEHMVWRTLFTGYLTVAGNVVGWLWHREPVVYGYIAHSVQHFVSWQEFARALGASGFEVTGVSRKLLGGIALHRARRHGPSRGHGQGAQG